MLQSLGGYSFFFFFFHLPSLPIPLCLAMPAMPCQARPCQARPRHAMPCNADGRQERAKIKLVPVAPGVTRLFLCLLRALWLGLVQLFSSTPPHPPQNCSLLAARQRPLLLLMLLLLLLLFTSLTVALDSIVLPQSLTCRIFSFSSNYRLLHPHPANQWV